MSLAETFLQTGIFSDISNESYHAGPGLSSTGLREFAKSPAHYQEYLKRTKAPTEAMKFGTGFHELIGEPTLFAKKYVKAPEGIDKRTTVGKAAWATFIAENEGKEILSHEDYDRLDGMLYSVLKNKTALTLLTNGQSEQSIYWIDRETKVLCKCRPDYLRTDGIVVDLKTAEDASAKGFQRSIANYGYHIQSAWYLEGVSNAMNEPVSDFVHLVVEKKAPYGIGLFTLDDISLNYARAEIRNLLVQFAECSAKNEWPSYTSDIQNVSLPNWMY